MFGSTALLKVFREDKWTGCVVLWAKPLNLEQIEEDFAVQDSQNALQTGEYNNTLTVMVVTDRTEEKVIIVSQGSWLLVCALHVQKLCSSFFALICVFVAAAVVEFII